MQSVRLVFSLAHPCVRSLCFVNGVAIGADGESVVLSETSRGRLQRFQFNDSSLSLFSLLPGMPDNVRQSRTDESLMWVGMSSRIAGVQNVLSVLPTLRSLIARLFPYDWLLKCAPPYGLLVAVDANSGDIVRTLIDPNGTTAYISEVHTMRNSPFALLGSFLNPYIDVIRVDE